MVDAFGAFDEGQDSWQAMPAQPMPSMPMGGMDAGQQQFDLSAGAQPATTAPFGGLDEADFPVQAQPAKVLIQTASGISTSLDDDLTEEERMIVAAAAEHQQELKKAAHDRMMEEARLKQERRNKAAQELAEWQTRRQTQSKMAKDDN